MKLKREPQERSRQSGGVMVLFGIALAVLIGFLGIVVDLGRLFVTRPSCRRRWIRALAAAAGAPRAQPAGPIRGEQGGQRRHYCWNAQPR
jgi:Flp pilus assembly protein TadG